MTLNLLRSSALFAVAAFCLPAALAQAAQSGSSSSNGPANGQSSSSAQVYAHEKAPSLVDPAGPTISLVSVESLFDMAAALNACGYDEGLEESAPVRKRVRAEVNQALAKSEDARAMLSLIHIFRIPFRVSRCARSADNSAQISSGARIASSWSFPHMITYDTPCAG